MFGPELVGRLVEVLGEILHDSQVPFYGTLSIITTLEFLQHHFSKLGHRDLLVTHKILLPKRDCHRDHYAYRPPRQRLRSNALTAFDPLARLS